MTDKLRFSFVICNEGYTIERYIHGWDASYNDIQPWDYFNIPKVFGAKEGYKGYRIKTRDELTKLFADQAFCHHDSLQVCVCSLPASKGNERC